jgi:hypothetical protein
MLAYHGLEENEDEDMENPAEDNIDNVGLENDVNGDLPLPATQDNLAMVAKTMTRLIWNYFISMIYFNLRWLTCSWARLRLSYFL